MNDCLELVRVLRSRNKHSQHQLYFPLIQVFFRWIGENKSTYLNQNETMLLYPHTSVLRGPYLLLELVSMLQIITVVYNSLSVPTMLPSEFLSCPSFITDLYQ